MHRLALLWREWSRRLQICLALPVWKRMGASYSVTAASPTFGPPARQLACGLLSLTVGWLSAGVTSHTHLPRLRSNRLQGPKLYTCVCGVLLDVTHSVLCLEFLHVVTCWFRTAILLNHARSKRKTHWSSAVGRRLERAGRGLRYSWTRLRMRLSPKPCPAQARSSMLLETGQLHHLILSSSVAHQAIQSCATFVHSGPVNSATACSHLHARNRRPSTTAKGAHGHVMKKLAKNVSSPRRR